MADTRFFQKKQGGLNLADIAACGEVVLPEGIDTSKTFEDVADLENATEKDISWAFIPAARDQLKLTKAGAVIIPESFKDLVPSGTIPLISKDAHRSYGLVACAFYPSTVEPFISPAAHIDSSA